MMFMNARMYSVSTPTRLAWKQLFDAVVARSGVGPMTWLEHEPPLLISQLWTRNDLGCAMMCGLPVSLRNPAPTILAAVVPSPLRYEQRPVYMSDLAVRADAPYRTLQDTFGGVAGTTVPDSQSGYFAFRHRLLAFQDGKQPLYRKCVDGLLNARGVIAALSRGDIDIGPLDGFVHDLLRATEPDFANQVRILESTEPTPVPPIVSTATLSPDEVSALREAFAWAGKAEELAEVRRTLLIQDFCHPSLADYEPLAARAHAVEMAPMPWPPTA